MKYRIPPRLAYVVHEDHPSGTVTLYLMPLPDGAPLQLRDSSGWIWLLAAEGAEIAESLAEIVERPVEEIRPDIEEFLAQLVGRGLLLQDVEEVARG